MADQVTTKFKVDISDLKKGISEASRQIKLANAEFKAASSGMDNWSKSADGVSAKINQLEKVLGNQNKILDSYKKQLELIKKEYGENSKEADDMRIKIANQQAAVNKTTSELNSYRQQLEELVKAQEESANAADDQAKAYDDLKDSIDEQQKRLDELKDAYKNVVVEEGKNSDSAKELSKQIEDLSGELKQNKDALEDADEAANSFDHSLDDLDPEGQADGFTVLRGALADLVANGIMYAAGAIKDFAKDVVKTGMDFDSAMSEVGAISGATGKDLEMLRDTAKEYGATTVFSASEAADALKYMSLAGWDAQTSASSLEGVLNLAAATGMDLGKASDMVTDYLSAFGLEADQSSYFADLLAYAQSNANTTAEGLGEAYKNVAANMHAAGQDVETTTALLATMANQGLKGSESGTALAAVLRDMTNKMDTAKLSADSFNKQAETMGKDTNALTTALKKAGVTNSEFNKALETSNGDANKFIASLQGMAKKGTDVSKIFKENDVTMDEMNSILTTLSSSEKDFSILIGDTNVKVTDSNGNFRDMTEILLDVQKATDGMGDAERAAALSTTFTADSIKGLNLLFNAGVDSAKGFEEELRHSEGTAKEMSDAMNDNLAGDLKNLDSMLDGVKINLYEQFEPALRAGVKALQGLVDVIQFFIDNGDTVCGIITAIAGAIGGYLAYSTALTVMKDGWMALTIVEKGAAAAQWALNAAQNASPIGILITIIGALVGAFMYLWNTSEDFRAFWGYLWDQIKETAGYVIDFIVDIFSKAWDAIKVVWDVVVDFFKAIWDGISNAFSTVVDFFGKLFSDAWNAITTVWNVVVSFFTGIWDGISNAFSAVATFFTNMFTGAWNGIKAVWNGVVGFFKGIWDGITGIFSTVANFFSTIFQGAADAIKNIFDAIIGFIKAPINFIIRGINAFIGGLNKIQIPDWVPAVGGKGINIPLIPELAEGGILKKGQLGFLEGNGAEAVVPLDQNKKWINAVANDLRKTLIAEGLIGSGAEVASTVNNNYNFVQTNNSPKALSRLEIYRQTKNQLAYAKGV